MTTDKDAIRGYGATVEITFDDPMATNIEDAIYTAERLAKEWKVGTVCFAWEGDVKYYVKASGTVLQRIRSEYFSVMRLAKNGGAA